jgi:hypothetical protein
MAHWNALAPVQSVQICEHVRLLEAASALLGQEIELANKYSVKDHRTGAPLFYAVEQTDCFSMQLKQCFGDCAAWSVEMLYTGRGGAEQALRMERPWTCTCLCFNRPTVYITDVTSGRELGHVTDPCNCIGMDLAAVRPNGEKIFSVDGGCCQLGTWCPMPCGPCSKVEYTINDRDGVSAGMLTKKVPGCFKFFLAPDVDNYIVDFDLRNRVWKNTEHKAMMIAMALFMDFHYFSDNSNDNGRDGPIDGAGQELLGMLGGGGGGRPMY